MNRIAEQSLRWLVAVLTIAALLWVIQPQTIRVWSGPYYWCFKPKGFMIVGSYEEVMYPRTVWIQVWPVTKAYPFVIYSDRDGMHVQWWK